MVLSPREEQYVRNMSKGNETVHIFPWQRRAMDLGLDVMYAVARVAPETAIRLQGSVALGIAGQRDIDLTGTACHTTFLRHEAAISQALGQRPTSHPDSLVWHIDAEAFRVSVYLLDPARSDQAARQQARLEYLLGNRSALRAYELLKWALDGRSQREYFIQKSHFFNALPIQWPDKTRST